ncbi:MAG TPA: HRDC domain-containing protein [Thermodesulfobacteriota bacterium]|nr:HRDC domain-containing protein [Thermodesulfobacteriota bacterium]
MDRIRKLTPLDSNPELELAFDYVRLTGRNLFLTGKAGTGKTTFLQSLKNRSPKRLIVVAPTGVAAINAGGVTIHSFFQMPFGPLIPGRDPAAGKAGGPYRFSNQKKELIRSLDLLVIDEISMVRADLLDGIDGVLRRLRRETRPFGGVQLLMIGDLQQLPPVVKEEEWEILSAHYDTPFFFGSLALAQTEFVTIELKRIYRQSDARFIDLLAKVRENRLNEEDLKILNKRYRHFKDQLPPEGAITLTTHNYQAERINQARLDDLPGRPRTFQAQLEGEFPPYAYPTAFDLVLKPGAQVMFVKNDLSPEKLFYNGKIGRIKSLDDDGLMVECPGDPEPIQVEPAEWKNIKYSLNETTQAIEETETGRFTQLPLKLAWAITIHKSQGLTFDQVIIEAQQAFAEGQVYVALSRCRSLEGLILSTPLEPRAIRNSSVVEDFTRRMEKEPTDRKKLEEARKEYQAALLDDLFDFSGLLRSLFICLKIAGEHRSVLAGATPSFFGPLIDTVKAEISGVAERFAAQRHQIAVGAPDLETHALLQERVAKAAAYFIPKMEALVLSPLLSVPIETDNKEAKKALQKALDTAVKEATAKRDCLEACRSGIVFSEYLKVRALSRIKEKVAKPEPPKEDRKNFSETINHDELYQQLKKWRSARAAERGQPAYCILHNTALAEISARLPATRDELVLIKGLKGKRGKEFGEEILEMVVQYQGRQKTPRAKKD